MSAPTAQKTISVTIDESGHPSVDPVVLHHGEKAEWTTSSGLAFDLAWDKTPSWEFKAVAGKSWGHRKQSHHLMRHEEKFEDAPQTAKYTITLYDAAGNVVVVNDPDMVMDT